MATRTTSERQDALKKRVIFGIAAAATAGAITYGGIRLQRHLKSKKETVQREDMLDKALLDTMDCSDPVTTY